MSVTLSLVEIRYFHITCVADIVNKYLHLSNFDRAIVITLLVI